MGQPLARATVRHTTHRGAHPWPFMQQPEGDIRTTEFGVGVPRRQEVEFADGTRVWLMRVDRQGVPDLFLRELGDPAAGTLVDLRRLAPDLVTDLPIANTRDVPGIVHFSLRARFKSRDALVEAAIAMGSPA
ncbi:MAG: hypothetical protein K0R58_22 [Ramlibacter sp.]|jgi:hypothetical protein|nr:hypothetical protein [Ramlibacter sp.]